MQSSQQSRQQSRGISQNKSSALQSAGNQAVHSIRQTQNGKLNYNDVGFINAAFMSQAGSRMNHSASQPIMTSQAKFQQAAYRNQNYNLNEDQVRDFMKQLEQFNREFGYSRDPNALADQKYAKNDLYRELNDVQSLNYNKYFYGLAPDDQKNRFYYGMNNQNYYNHNNVFVPSGDINDGNLLSNGNFRLQAEGRQNGYYYSQMRANEFKKHLGVGRILGNNERESQIDPKILDTANQILQHQERLKTRLRDKYRKANQGLRKIPDDQKYRNRQMMAVYNNIENQQKMILELVNNTITSREKDLQRKNEELRRKIEELERQQVIENISDDEDEEESSEEDDNQNQQISSRHQTKNNSPSRSKPQTQNRKTNKKKPTFMSDMDNQVQHEFADEFIDHGLGGGLPHHGLQTVQSQANLRNEVNGFDNNNNNDNKRPPQSTRSNNMMGGGMNQSKNGGFGLQRKDKYTYEDPDLKQRPTTPVIFDGIQGNNIKMPTQPLKVPAYFPELPQLDDEIRDDDSVDFDKARKDEYDRLKNQTRKEGADPLLKELGLPASDPSDDVLKDMKGWNDKLMREKQKEEQQQQQKRDENNMLKERFQQALMQKYGLAKIPAQRRRKAKLFAFFVMLSLWYQVQRNKLNKRERALQDMENGIKIYMEVARNFMMKSVKNILLNLVNEPNQDMNITDLPRTKEATLSRNQSNKLLKLQVRVKGILQNILNVCNPTDFPQPLIKFFAHLTELGAFMPKNFLTPFEQSRLKLDQYGSLDEFSADQENLIIAFFLFTKVLVAQILLQADLHAGVRTDQNSNLFKNLKVLATFIQEIVFDHFSSRLLQVTIVKNPNDDGVRQVLMKPNDIEPFFAYSDPQWLGQVSEIFNEIMTKINQMIKRARQGLKKINDMQKTQNMNKNKTNEVSYKPHSRILRNTLHQTNPSIYQNKQPYEFTIQNEEQSIDDNLMQSKIQLSNRSRRQSVTNAVLGVNLNGLEISINNSSKNKHSKNQKRSPQPRESFVSSQSFAINPTPKRNYPHYSQAVSPRRNQPKNQINGCGEQLYDQDIKIDRGLSDIKIPYFPDFGVPIYYNENDGQVKDNWKRIFDQVIRNPQHSNLIQYIKAKNAEKERQKQELKNLRDKEVNKNQMESFKINTNSHQLKRKISLYKNCKEYSQVMDIGSMGDSFIRQKENNNGHSHNQYQSQSNRRPSTLNLYTTIISGQKINDQTTNQLNPFIRQKFQIIGSKYQKILNEIDRINLSTEKFSGFLDLIKKDSPQKPSPQLNNLNQSVIVDKSNFPKLQLINEENTHIKIQNHNKLSLNSKLQQSKIISQSLRNSPRQRSQTNTNNINLSLKASYDVGKIQRKIQLLDIHQETINKKLSQNQDQYEGLKNELSDWLNTKHQKKLQQIKKQKHLDSIITESQSFDKHNQIKDILENLNQNHKRKNKRLKRKTQSIVDVENLEGSLFQSLESNIINTNLQDLSINESQQGATQKQQSERQLLNTKKYSNQTSNAGISDLQTQTQTPLDIVKSIKKHKLKVKNVCKSSQVSPRLKPNMRYMKINDTLCIYNQLNQ